MLSYSIATLETSKARAQLLTVPPYVAAFCTQMTLAALSDHLQVRGPIILLALLLAGLGYLLLLLPSTAGQAFSTHYAGAFLACMGTYTGVPLMLSWAQANFGSETKRAAGLALMFAFGQTFSVVASFIWPASDAPLYRKGYVLCMVWQWWGMVVCAGLIGYFWRENRRRDREEGRPEVGSAPRTAEEADRARGYRYMI
jgi:MFS family permease